MIDVRPVRSRRDLSEFIDLPERLYRDDPAWTPALKPELRKLLGEDFCQMYEGIKMREFEDYLRVISPWEREHLLLNV